MNFPCDASSSPLSSSSSRMGAFLHKKHYWLAFPGGGTSLQQSEGPGTKTKSCRRAISSAVQAGSTPLKKKSALKYCSFFLKNHFLASPVCRRVSQCAQLDVSSAVARSSRAAVPQRPLFQKPGILFHKTWNGSIKKLLCISHNFLGNFRETNPRHRRTSRQAKREQITRRERRFGRKCLSLYRSVIN